MDETKAWYRGDELEEGIEMLADYRLAQAQEVILGAGLGSWVHGR